MRDQLYRLRVILAFACLAFFSWIATVVGTGPPDAGRNDRGYVGGVVLEAATPFQKALDFPAKIAGDLWSNYAALVGVRRNNEVLRGRIAELEQENLQYREALIASGHLEQIAQMRSELATPMLPAEVVGQDVSPWYRSLLLDRGNRDRVRTGMPVVTDQGLVGLVTASSPEASRTMLLLDTQSAVDGVVQRSRARGIIRGGSSGLVFEFYARGDDVEMGDTVITSGLGGIYPKALLIGEVTAIKREKERLVHYAELEPAVDFGRLEQVFVLLWRSPGIDLLYRGEGDLPSPPATP